MKKAIFFFFTLTAIGCADDSQRWCVVSCTDFVKTCKEQNKDCYEAAKQCFEACSSITSKRSSGDAEAKPTQTSRTNGK